MEILQLLCSRHNCPANISQLNSLAHQPTQLNWTANWNGQSYVTTDGQPDSLSWNKTPIWGLRSDLYYCQTVAGLLMCGALSEERTGLSLPESQSAVISLLSACTICILLVIKYIYIQHIQDLCNSRLSTEDHALSLVAPATTAV
jgi:hypothetical protein